MNLDPAKADCEREYRPCRTSIEPAFFFAVSDKV